MTSNCIGWISYSLLKNDIFMFLGCAPGLIISMWLNYGVIKLQYYQTLSSSSSSFQKHEQDRLIKDVPVVYNVYDDYEKDIRQGDSICTWSTTSASSTDSTVVSSSSDHDVEHGPQQPINPQLDMLLSSTHNSDKNYHTIITIDNQINQEETAATTIPHTETTTTVTSTITTTTITTTTLHEKRILSILSFWLILLSLITFLQNYNIMSNATTMIFLGLMTNINSIFFYAAPLSTIKDVIKSRCSKSIHRMTLITYLLNSSFWTLYGFVGSGKVDVWIALPNGIGLVLCFVQLLLCFMF